MTTNHLILDFSHVYCDEKIPKNDRVHWLDCSDIAECDLYCSKRAEEEIRARIEPYGIRGIHFLEVPRQKRSSLQIRTRLRICVRRLRR